MFTAADARKADNQTFDEHLTSVVRDPEGRIVEGAPGELKQQRDVWTFSRNLSDRDPNWKLDETDEA